MEKKIRLTMYLPEGIDPEDPGAILKHICSIMDEHAPADTGLDTDDPDISIDVFYLNEPSGAGNGISGDEPSSCGCGEDEEEDDVFGDFEYEDSFFSHSEDDADEDGSDEDDPDETNAESFLGTFIGALIGGAIGTLIGNFLLRLF